MTRCKDDKIKGQGHEVLHLVTLWQLYCLFTSTAVKCLLYVHLLTYSLKQKTAIYYIWTYVPRPLHVSHIHGHGSCATGCSAANVPKVSDPVEQPHLLSQQTSVLFVVKMAASVDNMQARPIQTSSTVMALNSLQCYIPLRRTQEDRNWVCRLITIIKPY